MSIKKWSNHCEKNYHAIRYHREWWLLGSTVFHALAGTYHFDITALVRKANVAGMFCHKSSGNLGELSCNVVIFTVKSAISSSKISGILENSWELVLSVHGVYI